MEDVPDVEPERPVGLGVGDGEENVKTRAVIDGGCAAAAAAATTSEAATEPAAGSPAPVAKARRGVAKPTKEARAAAVAAQRVQAAVKAAAGQ